MHHILSAMHDGELFFWTMAFAFVGLGLSWGFVKMLLFLLLMTGLTIRTLPLLIAYVARPYDSR
jgi:hypothetical protein